MTIFCRGFSPSFCRFGVFFTSFFPVKNSSVVPHSFLLDVRGEDLVPECPISVPGSVSCKFCVTACGNSLERQLH